jgi:hypothetical protein
LNTQGAKLEATVGGLRSAIEILSVDLVHRAEADSLHLQAVEAHSEATGRGFAAVTDILRESSHELKTVPAKIDTIAGTIVEGMRREVSASIDHVASDLRNMALLLEQNTGALTGDFDRVQTRTAGEATIGSPDLVNSVREATDAMRRASEESRKLTEAIHQFQSLRAESASKKTDGFFRWPWR